MAYAKKKRRTKGANGQSRDVVFVPSPAQSKILRSKARHVNVIAGRRFGKTEVGAIWALERVREKPNQTIAICAPTYPQVQGFWFPRLSARIPSGWLTKEPTKTSPPKFDFKNGSQIVMFSLEKYENLRGWGFDAVIIDEIKDVKSEAYYNIIRPAIAQTKGRTFKIGTPDGVNNWFYKEFTSEEESEAFHFTTAEGGLVDQREIEQARASLDERTFRQEFLAEFLTPQKLAYYSFSRTANILQGVPFDPAADTFVTFDFNATDKPFSVVLIQKIAENTYCAVWEYIHKYTQTETACRAIVEYFEERGFYGNLTVNGDSSGRSMSTKASRTDYEIIEYFLKNYRGFKINTRRTKSIRDRVMTTNAAFLTVDGTRKLFISSECRKLIEDLEKTELKSNGQELDGTDPERTHATDALSYFCYNELRVELNVTKATIR